MKKIDLGQTIQVLANVAVLAGIGFLAYELRQNTRATLIASTEATLSGAYQLDLRIASDPEVAELLLKQEPLTEAERLRKQRWYYAALRQWETARYLSSISALDDSFWQAYRHELIQIMSGADAIVEYWQGNKQSFTPAFNEEMERMVQEIGRE
jgi:hypothetical protein